MTRPPFTVDDRELAILVGLTDGATTKEIAAELEINRDTVSNIVMRIRRRFAASNNEQLVAILFRRGLLS